MSRKRTNLDTSEANFVYVHVLLELNKFEEFNKLFITERNKLTDEICLSVIDKANKNEDDKEALKFELLSYKLSDEEKKKYYNPGNYIDNLPKPENFNKLLEEKYLGIIKETVKEKFKVSA